MNITKEISMASAALACAATGFIAPATHAEAIWTTGACAPSEWTALDGNLLAGLVGTTVGNLSYLAKNVAGLTDGEVPDPASADGLCGFCNGSTIEWKFDAPKTLERIRISAQTAWGGRQYHRINVSRVEVRHSAEGQWEQVAVPQLAFSSDAAEGSVPYATLGDAETGALAEGVLGIRLAFATDGTYAYYCAEIEAVGFAEATGPVVGTFGITPARTSATVAGSIADAGTDATACDVYLSIGNAGAVRIAKGVTGPFEHRIRGLAAGTSYAYEISFVNNAATPKATSIGGTFATLAADAQTASWIHGEYDPAEWTALEGNLLRSLDATEKSGLSFAASNDATKLTDGGVPSPAAGTETVGFSNQGTIAWTFEVPMTIEKIRLSSLWETTAYNGISVSAVQARFPGSPDWQTLDVPAVQWTGGTKLGQTETLSDAETGVLARNAVGLKIVFGAQKAAIANYYAEIEAVGHASGDELRPTLIILR